MVAHKPLPITAMSIRGVEEHTAKKSVRRILRSPSDYV